MPAEEERTEDPRERLERIGWQTAASRRAPAAVSASESARRGGPADVRPGVANPVAGPYEGYTDESFSRRVSFRFLGRGIRDLAVGDRLVAQWIPVNGGDAQTMARGAEVRLSWVGPREVHGSVVRRRRGRPQVMHFVADHRFSGLAR